MSCDLLEALGLESLLHPLLVLARARCQLRVQLAQHLHRERLKRVVTLFHLENEKAL